jgi:hypothetical protein
MEIKRHSFFKNVNWTDMHTRELHFIGCCQHIYHPSQSRRQIHCTSHYLLTTDLLRLWPEMRTLIRILNPFRSLPFSSRLRTYRSALRISAGLLPTTRRIQIFIHAKEALLPTLSAFRGALRLTHFLTQRRMNFTGKIIANLQPVWISISHHPSESPRLPARWSYLLTLRLISTLSLHLYAQTYHRLTIRFQGRVQCEAPLLVLVGKYPTVRQ